MLVYIVGYHSTHPPLPLLKEEIGNRTFKKLSDLEGGVRNVLLESEDKPERGEVDVEIRGCYFFITLQFNLIYCVWGKSKVPIITFWILSVSS